MTTRMTFAVLCFGAAVCLLGLLRLFATLHAPDVVSAGERRLRSVTATPYIDLTPRMEPGARARSADDFFALKDVTPTPHPRAATEIFARRVFVLVFDPVLSDGQRLSQRLKWNDPVDMTRSAIEFFKRASRGRVSYSIARTSVITSAWPQKEDGFRYNETGYLAVISDTAKPHEPDSLDYLKILNDQSLDVCGSVNRGEIDELWMYGGPWFGFFESALAGPRAYFYNGAPITDTTCNHLLPIMGLNMREGLANAVHIFGHRMEATMTKAYGDWEQNRAYHNWDRFGLAKAQSPDFTYSGCSSMHFTPNGTQEYQYDRPDPTDSNCEDFLNYPNLSVPSAVTTPIGCDAWACDAAKYYGFWFEHLPFFADCAPDGIASDWWRLFVEPDLALSPVETCHRATNTPFPTPTPINAIHLPIMNR